MKVFPDKLSATFAKGLAPLYLLYGDEPLGRMECGDMIRHHAKEQGFSEREVIVANDDSDWVQLRASLGSMSLFADQRLVELRMLNGKTGRQGPQILKDYAADPAPDVLLLIESGRLEKSQTSSAWFKALDKIGVTVPFYPLNSRDMPGWLKRRLGNNGLQASTEAIALLAERVEGNTLAADQEVKRLALLFPEGRIDVDEVLYAVSDSARYNVTDLVGHALNGNGARALHVLNGLRGEAVAPALILWALSQEIRAGARIAQSMAVGMSRDAAFKAAGVWRNRMPALSQALNRHDETGWLSMLSTLSQADRVMKGHADGDIWHSFKTLTVVLATGRTLLVVD